MLHSTSFCQALLTLRLAQMILHQEHEKEKERELILSVIDDGEEVRLLYLQQFLRSCGD